MGDVKKKKIIPKNPKKTTTIDTGRQSKLSKKNHSLLKLIRSFKD